MPGAGEPPVGTIGVWASEWAGEEVSETGWMVLPEHQGKGHASAALAALLERARPDDRWGDIHAFPGATNAPSNALCRKFGFEQLGEAATPTTPAATSRSTTGSGARGRRRPPAPRRLAVAHPLADGREDLVLDPGLALDHPIERVLVEHEQVRRRRRDGGRRPRAAEHERDLAEVVARGRGAAARGRPGGSRSRPMSTMKNSSPAEPCSVRTSPGAASRSSADDAIAASSFTDRPLNRGTRLNACVRGSAISSRLYRPIRRIQPLGPSVAAAAATTSAMPRIWITVRLWPRTTNPTTLAIPGSNAQQQPERCHRQAAQRRRLQRERDERCQDAGHGQGRAGRPAPRCPGLRQREPKGRLDRGGHEERDGEAVQALEQLAHPLARDDVRAEGGRRAEREDDPDRLELARRAVGEAEDRDADARDAEEQRGRGRPRWPHAETANGPTMRIALTIPSGAWLRAR